MTMHVGIVGTGKMGTAIALNLLDHGYKVSAWNIDRGMMDPVVAAGAASCESLEALVAGVDAVISMLWDDDVARAISLGRIIPAAGTGQLLIETTTLSPKMYESLAHAAQQRGVDFLACPVFGSVDGARSGTLTLLPGGSAQAFDKGRELLGAMGSTVTFTGSPGASGHLKLAFNSMLAVLADSIGELLAIAAKAGVNRDLTIDALVQALGRVATKRQQLIERDTQPRFSANALLKDLRLARAARQDLGANAPLMDLAFAEFEKAIESARAGDEDYIAAGLALERKFEPLS
ncbi:MAG TPA: NAD(P)-dependent oxidoreductase [Candidatus Baltobacteraceae bacterium]|jgi:2-hydroxy-3-oxopropionate reductase|nr:NAD(P)-dependent oxidoreductase [Candidatus Baltobacteraceae bacterium]